MIRNPPAKTSFGDLLRHILILEKKEPLPPVAAALGLSVRGFCSMLRNGGRFDPDAVAVLLRLIADERLPQWFFVSSGLLLVRHTIAASDGSNMTLRQRTVACAMDAIAAICDLADMLEVGILEALPKAMIEERLDHALGALLSIQLQLTPPALAATATPAADANAAAIVASHSEPHEGFPALVRRVLLTDRAVTLQALSEALNLSYQTLHARMLGNVAFLPAELRLLFRMFPDPRLADYLLTGTAYTAILRPAVIESRIDSSPIRTGLLSLREIVQFLGALLSAEDWPDAAIPMTLERHLEQAVRHLTTLRWNMTYIGHHSGARPQAIATKGADAA